MKNKITLILLILGFGLLFTLLLPRSSKAAGSCSGSVHCCDNVDEVKTPAGCKDTCAGDLGPCTPCTGTKQICTQQVNQGCNYNGSNGCNWTACNYYEISNTCQYNPPAPYCGDGSCNNAETQQSCPGDCGNPPPPSNTCSGDCFTGIGNCGDVGRQGASGSCSNGGLCCGFGGGSGSCSSSMDPSSLVLHVGETKDITASLDDGIYQAHIDWWSWGLTPDWYSWWQGYQSTYSTSVMSVSAVASGFYDSGGASNPWKTLRVTALSPGSGNIYTHGSISGSDGQQVSGGGYPECAINGASVTVLAPSCVSVTVPNVNVITSGTPQPITPTINFTSSSVANVSFSVAGANASVLPVTASTSPYGTNVSGISAGSTTYTALVNMADGSTCTGTGNIAVSAPGPWWQANGGDVVTNQSLQSTLQGGALTRFMSVGLGGFPGNVLYGVNTNLTKTNVSDTGWLGNTLYQGKTYDYNYFHDLVTGKLIPINLPATARQIDIVSGAASPDGYTYFQAPSDLVLDQGITISGNKKVVIFVNGNVNITRGDIIIQTPGQGFFMLIASGNITLASTIANLNGIYSADKIFATGVGNTKLNVKGSVVAWTGVSLQRDLGAGNTVNSAELFSYDPTLSILFPRSLIEDGVSWQEVIP